MFHKVMATVLFVHNLEACKAFYRDTLGLPMQESDANSAGFQLENIYLILLKAPAAADMVSEQPLDMTFAGGPRSLLAAGVDNVDAAYAALKAKGVAVLRPPTDQPWGLRTAYFADPEGHVWEINQPA
jgi:lactoylglutathione lyase